MKPIPFKTLDSAKVEISRLNVALAKLSSADPIQPNEPEAPLSLSEANAIIINLRVQIASLQARIVELERQLAEAKKAPVKPKTDPDDKGFQKLPAMTEENLAAAIHVETDFRKQNAMVRTLAAMQAARAIEQVKSSKRRK